MQIIVVNSGALVNLGSESVTIERGMRIAQLVIAPVVQVAVTEVSDLNSTERGAGGFAHRRIGSIGS